MELTGKCKEEFLVWYFNTYLKKDKYILIKDIEGFYSSIKSVFQNALIIEWFDSIGIYVNVLRYGVSEPNKWVVIRSLCENNLDFIYSSRTEATIQAIKKANEIYNTTHSQTQLHTRKQKQKFHSKNTFFI